MSKLIISEQIKAAWAMGWSARIINRYSVIGVSKKGSVLVKSDSSGLRYFFEDQIENTNITGYLYAGELAGNEPIPDGQKFRVKATGEESCGLLYDDTKDGISLDFGRGDKWIDKSLIEPVF